MSWLILFYPKRSPESFILISLLRVCQGRHSRREVMGRHWLLLTRLGDLEDRVIFDDMDVCGRRQRSTPFCVNILSFGWDIRVCYHGNKSIPFIRTYRWQILITTYFIHDPAEGCYVGLWPNNIIINEWSRYIPQTVSLYIFPLSSLGREVKKRCTWRKPRFPEPIFGGKGYPSCHWWYFTLRKIPQTFCCHLHWKYVRIGP